MRPNGEKIESGIILIVKSVYQHDIEFFHNTFGRLHRLCTQRHLYKMKSFFQDCSILLAHAIKADIDAYSNKVTISGLLHRIIDDQGTAPARGAYFKVTARRDTSD